MELKKINQQSSIFEDKTTQIRCMCSQKLARNPNDSYARGYKEDFLSTIYEVIKLPENTQQDTYTMLWKCTQWLHFLLQAKTKTCI